MMSGNPNWWSMHPQISSSSQFVYGSSLLSSNQDDNNNNSQPNQDFPLRSWTQLLRGDGGGEEEESSSAFDQQQKKLESWEDQVLNLNQATCFSRVLNDDVKQELSNATCQLFGRLDQQQDHDDQFHRVANNNNRAWNQVMMPHVSSPNSCITTLSNNNNNFLNFSGARKATEEKRSYHQHQDHSSHECNSTSSGGVSNKKPRVQQSSPQPALKVRKEKLGDRITALHQLVSPFGKTDTASVLSEAIGYIRFLQSQIEALSSPYMRNASGSTGSSSHQHSVQERSCLFPQPQEHNQFLNHDTGIDVRAASKQDSQGQAANDLRSRGLCLVPIACTQHMGNDNGADYWAPAALGGGF